jgi:hypothetical protein
MKTSKAFRLSIQAVSTLRTLKEYTGTNETAIVEQALAFYERAYRTARLGDVVASPLGATRSKVETEKPHKRRKRRK